MNAIDALIEIKKMNSEYNKCKQAVLVGNPPCGDTDETWNKIQAGSGVSRNSNVRLFASSAHSQSGNQKSGRNPDAIPDPHKKANAGSYRNSILQAHLLDGASKFSLERPYELE